MGIEGAALAHVVVIVLIVVPTYLATLRPVITSAPRLLLKAVGGPIVAAVLGGAVAYAAMFSLDGSFLRLAVGGTAGVIAYLIVALPMIREHLPSRITERLAPVLSGYDSVLRFVARKPVRT
jgi:PST family polysaccharide transporter